MNKLGQFILESRKKKGLSHETLGELAFYDRSNISNIEAGKKAASNDFLKRVATVLDVPFERLIALKLIDRMLPEVRKWVLLELQNLESPQQQSSSNDF